MPKLYTDMRDSCMERKRKKKGKLSDKDMQDCKKMAAIAYYKRTGKPVQHSDAELAKADNLPDKVDLDILIEQLDVFGSLKNHEDFNLEEDKDVSN